MSECVKIAPKGWFRVIGKDGPRDQGWKKGDYHDLSLAEMAAVSPSRSFVRFQIFDDKGECLSPPVVWS
ncbi:MAG: hypothetical protein ACXAC5_01740 [Promethearchaeota archaeon]|jgi:hypothetical protein